MNKILVRYVVMNDECEGQSEFEMVFPSKQAKDDYEDLHDNDDEHIEVMWEKTLVNGTRCPTCCGVGCDICHNTGLMLV